MQYIFYSIDIKIQIHICPKVILRIDIENLKSMKQNLSYFLILCSPNKFIQLQ